MASVASSISAFTVVRCGPCTPQPEQAVRPSWRRVSAALMAWTEKRIPGANLPPSTEGFTVAAYIDAAPPETWSTTTAPRGT